MSKSNYCTLLLVRHGQTDWNKNELIQGHSDIPLNKEGEKQAKILSGKLKKIKFDFVYSSDLVRAKRTAELIILDKKLAIQTSKLLRERRHGKYEGKPYKALENMHKIWENLDKQQRLTLKPYKGFESDGEIIKRTTTFLREVAISHPGKTILIVGHGGVMRVLLNHLSDETFKTNSIGNAAFIKLKSDGVEFFIEELSGIHNP